MPTLLKYSQRTKSNGINGLKGSLFSKGIRILGAFIVSLMAYIERNIFLPLFRMKISLRVRASQVLHYQLLQKKIFGAPEKGNFSMDETRKDDTPQVSMEK
jgi:hypothetical protein